MQPHTFQTVYRQASKQCCYLHPSPSARLIGKDPRSACSCTCLVYSVGLTSGGPRSRLHGDRQLEDLKVTTACAARWEQSELLLSLLEKIPPLLGGPQTLRRSRPRCRFQPRQLSSQECANPSVARWADFGYERISSKCSRVSALG